MTIRKLPIEFAGGTAFVMLRLVNTPYKAFIVEHETSYALLEIRGKRILLREARGRWQIGLLKAIEDQLIENFISSHKP